MPIAFPAHSTPLPLALDGEPAGGFAGWAAGLVDTMGGPGAGLAVRVEDDGTGGADPAGGGLTGLRSRVAALDGSLHVHSPLGGPTTVTAELPCA